MTDAERKLWRVLRARQFAAAEFRRQVPVGPYVDFLCYEKRLVIEVDGNKVPHTTCFVPSTPTPVSGMVVMVPSEEVLAVDMTVEEGLKFLVSGGVASPSNIQTREKIGNRTSEESSNEAG